MRALNEGAFAEDDECCSIAESMIDEIEAFSDPRGGKFKGSFKKNMMKLIKVAKAEGRNWG